MNRNVPAYVALREINSAANKLLTTQADGLTIFEAGLLASVGKSVINKLAIFQERNESK